MNEKISIIVPMHNAKEYIERCIESLIHQTYTNLEILLIDDGSTDDTKSICAKYVEVDNRIKLYSQKNSGVSVARNLGLKNATGKYIGFVDADDWIQENMYDVLNKNMKNYNAELSICEKMNEKAYSVPNIVKEETEIVNINADECINLLFEKSNKYFGGYVWNKLFLLEIIKKENILFHEDISMMEDSLFIIEYITKCNSFKAVYDNSKLYHYIQYENSLSNTFSEKRITLLQTYERILDILDKYKAEHEEAAINLDNIKRMCLKSGSEIRYQIKKSKKDIYNNILAKIKENKKQYLCKIMLSSKISLTKKIDLFIDINCSNIYRTIKSKVRK